MDELKPMTCQNCGGHIDRHTMKCPYCETSYNGNIEPVPKIIYGERIDYDTLRAKVYVDENEYLEQEVAIRFAREKLMDAISKGIEPYVDVIEHRDPMSFRRVIEGRIRLFKK